MDSTPMQRQAALTLRKSPWLIAIAYRLWRMTRPRFTVGVVGVVFNPAGDVLIVEHVFHRELPWGLPGGWVERNEDPALGLQRELVEELQLVTEVGQIVALEKTYPNHLDLAYLCYPQSAIGALSYELASYRWIAPTELPDINPFHRHAIGRALKLYRQDRS